MPGIRKKFYYHIDMIRFVLSVIIVYFHLLDSAIVGYASDPKYEELAKAITVGRIEVVYFFIISGFFCTVRSEKIQDEACLNISLIA